MRYKVLRSFKFRNKLYERGSFFVTNDNPQPSIIMEVKSRLSIGWIRKLDSSEKPAKKVDDMGEKNPSMLDKVLGRIKGKKTENTEEVKSDVPEVKKSELDDLICPKEKDKTVKSDKKKK